VEFPLHVNGEVGETIESFIKRSLSHCLAAHSFLGDIKERETFLELDSSSPELVFEDPIEALLHFDMYVEAIARFAEHAKYTAAFLGTCPDSFLDKFAEKTGSIFGWFLQIKDDRDQYLEFLANRIGELTRGIAVQHRALSTMYKAYASEIDGADPKRMPDRFFETLGDLRQLSERLSAIRNGLGTYVNLVLEDVLPKDFLYNSEADTDFAFAALLTSLHRVAYDGNSFAAIEEALDEAYEFDLMGLIAIAQKKHPRLFAELQSAEADLQPDRSGTQSRLATEAQILADPVNAPLYTLVLFHNGKVDVPVNRNDPRSRHFAFGGSHVTSEAPTPPMLGSDDGTIPEALDERNLVLHRPFQRDMKDGKPSPSNTIQINVN
jgi:hypothetical protein